MSASSLTPGMPIGGIRVHTTADDGTGAQVLTGYMSDCDTVYAERLFGKFAKCFSQGPALLRSLLLACDASSSSAAAGSGCGASAPPDALPVARVREVILNAVLSLDPAIIDIELVRDC